MKRRESREIAFQLLFQWAFQNDEELEQMIQNAVAGRQLEVDAFARTLAGSTMEHVEELDGLIQQYSDKWKLNRLSKVTLTVLRMSLCELTRLDDIPAGATINEAVELMKKYATEDEAAYVNGILGAFERARGASGGGE